MLKTIRIIQVKRHKIKFKDHQASKLEKEATVTEAGEKAKVAQEVSQTRAQKRNLI